MAWMPLAEGEHFLTIVGAERAVSKAGNEMTKVLFEADAEPGQSIYGYLPDRWTSQIRAFMRAFGIDPDMKISEWTGRRGRARVKRVTRDDKIYSNIDSYVPPEAPRARDAVRANPLDPGRFTAETPDNDTIAEEFRLPEFPMPSDPESAARARAFNEWRDSLGRSRDEEYSFSRDQRQGEDG